MANFKEVNKAIKARFPDCNIEMVRGCGYAYYGLNGYDKINSVFSHPTTTTTDEMIEFAIQDISEYLNASKI